MNKSNIVYLKVYNNITDKIKQYIYTPIDVNLNHNELLEYLFKNKKLYVTNFPVKNKLLYGICYTSQDISTISEIQILPYPIVNKDVNLPDIDKILSAEELTYINKIDQRLFDNKTKNILNESDYYLIQNNIYIFKLSKPQQIEEYENDITNYKNVDLSSIYIPMKNINFKYLEYENFQYNYNANKFNITPYYDNKAYEMKVFNNKIIFLGSFFNTFSKIMENIQYGMKFKNTTNMDTLDYRYCINDTKYIDFSSLDGNYMNIYRLINVPSTGKIYYETFLYDYNNDDITNINITEKQPLNSYESFFFHYNYEDKTVELQSYKFTNYRYSSDKFIIYNNKHIQENIYRFHTKYSDKFTKTIYIIQENNNIFQQLTIFLRYDQQQCLIENKVMLYNKVYDKTEKSYIKNMINYIDVNEINEYIENIFGVKFNENREFIYISPDYTFETQEYKDKVIMSENHMLYEESFDGTKYHITNVFRKPFKTTFLITYPSNESYDNSANVSDFTIQNHSFKYMDFTNISNFQLLYEKISNSCKYLYKDYIHWINDNTLYILDSSSNTIQTYDKYRWFIDLCKFNIDNKGIILKDIYDEINGKTLYSQEQYEHSIYSDFFMKIDSSNLTDDTIIKCNDFTVIPKIKTNLNSICKNNGINIKLQTFKPCYIDVLNKQILLYPYYSQMQVTTDIQRLLTTDYTNIFIKGQLQSYPDYIYVFDNFQYQTYNTNNINNIKLIYLLKQTNENSNFYIVKFL